MGIGVNKPQVVSTTAVCSQAQELLRVYREVEGKFNEVSVPFLIVGFIHATRGDTSIYENLTVQVVMILFVIRQRSLRIYPGMWHYYAELVSGEVVHWLATRAERESLRQHGEAIVPKL